ncbi:MAG TPA: DUF2207 domain-containing protein [Pseudogracilibacillus sp.]|nr:DUF2207 domain-containing protein [Pseudogracilibacillus sp.]
MKRLIYILTVVIGLILTFIAFPHETVLAKKHKLEELYIHTYIHEDGSATITEERKAYLSEGTENYDVIENLGKSKIMDFTVEENGKLYEFIDKWDIDASREDKAYKNGIITTPNGYELAWGIGKYGPHEYKIQYRVTNFIKQLEDSQILFWRYVNDETNTPPEKVRIEIETDKALNKDDEKIWAFGYKGDIHFKGGKVVATSHEALSKRDYVTILIKFADGQFRTEDVLNRTFEEVRDEAFEGSDYDSSGGAERPSKEESIWLYLLIPLIILFPFFIVIVVLVVILSNKAKYHARVNKYKNQYIYDYPYDGPFIDIYWFLLVETKSTKVEQLIAAFLLKWTKEDYIDIQSEEVGRIFKSELAIIYLRERNPAIDGFEEELFKMIIEASDGETKLEQKTFVKWVESNRSRVRKWEKDVRDFSLNLLKEENYYKTIEKRGLIFKSSNDELTDKGKQLEANVFRYMNYLRHYSLINEHEAVNVKIWDEIMIWAAVLGLTDEVYRQFQGLYPAYNQESAYGYVGISSSVSLSHSLSAAQSYTSSGGGGGSSSGGGGGGSFGGGSGGGTR